MSNKELITYLRSFAISKEIFNIKIKEGNIDILKRYYDDMYKKASILVMDDEYVGNTFDNLEKINILIKKS
ncbi:MAG: hypothetical protein MR296_00495 [Tenericutes bacterium]|nr:hypothetical protein [Mycoplasmatota bacterium]